MNAFVALLTSMDFVSFGCIRQLEQIEDRHQSIFASFDNCDIFITTISERPEIGTTMEHRPPKDILHVIQPSGLRNIHNTLLYTELVNFESGNCPPGSHE
jgi:hypothetical protein